LGPGGAGSSVAQSAPAHDCDAVTDAEQLGKVGTDDEDGLALGGEITDGAVDLDLAGDVDAAGGIPRFGGNLALPIVGLKACL
jgi:hypothetical protein